MQVHIRWQYAQKDIVIKHTVNFAADITVMSLSDKHRLLLSSPALACRQYLFLQFLFSQRSAPWNVDKYVDDTTLTELLKDRTKPSNICLLYTSPSPRD